MAQVEIAAEQEFLTGLEMMMMMVLTMMMMMMMLMMNRGEGPMGMLINGGTWLARRVGHPKLRVSARTVGDRGADHPE